MKIKAHQEEIKRREDLTLLEELNIQYDLRVKILIDNETREVVPFPFSLSSPFISLIFIQQILNNKEDVLLHILIAEAKDYLHKKLRISLKLNQID